MNANDRELNWIHMWLALLAPLLILALTGCNDDKDEPLNFGPEINPTEVEAALARPLQASDPLKIKIGEFVHFAETQMLNNRQDATSVSSDTGQTVVNRTELEDRIVLTVVQNKINYSGTEARKTSTELELAIAKNTESAISEAAQSTVAPKTMKEHVSKVLYEAESPLKTLAAVFAAENTKRVTYHNLRVGLETVSPPSQVSTQPNCLNIPGCKIRVYRIAFDQVIWDSPTKAEKVAFEFAMSEDVPYLAALMDKCATLLVAINADNPDSSKVLLRQCSPVLNFRWESAP